ncbi:MAG: hypothetical protein U9N34_03845, partial [Candidatus Cloacimonadota bacterium]|nr:hypothetical protein [Candidatus Cloacimonadota bacterium]
MKRYFIIVLLLAVSVILSANVSQYYFFDNPIIKSDNGFDIIEFENTQNHGKVGNPYLPYLGAKLLLPQNNEAV